MDDLEVLLRVKAALDRHAPMIEIGRILDALPPTQRRAIKRMLAAGLRNLDADFKRAELGTWLASRG
jgi:plasmid stability protein